MTKKSETKKPRPPKISVYTRKGRRKPTAEELGQVATPKGGKGKREPVPSPTTGVADA